jgi:MAPEG family
MPIPVWVLLGFAAWTLLILVATVGVYRWSRILTGRTAIATWRADEQQGSEWYRRAMRAHMNCLENLPIYTAIVVALLAARVTSPILDGLAIGPQGTCCALRSLGRSGRQGRRRSLSRRHCRSPAASVTDAHPLDYIGVAGP